MKRKIMLILAIACVSGCAIVREEKVIEEKFTNGVTLDDGRRVSATFDVKYNNAPLIDSLNKGDVNIDDFIGKLELIETINDGGSTIYKYNDTMKFSGMNEYYLLNCNSLDNIKNVFIAKNKDNLNGLCSLSYDDLDGVSMQIKEGTLSSKGATVIITDTSDRGNIYGSAYFVERLENESWIKLTPKIDMVFTSQGLYPDENGVLELSVNWLTYYGRLKSGTYRIVKDTSYAGEGKVHYITAEFKLK